MTESSWTLDASASELVAALRGAVDDADNRERDGEPGCLDCTYGTTPNKFNTGLCWYHRARAAIAKATTPMTPRLDASLLSTLRRIELIADRSLNPSHHGKQDYAANWREVKEACRSALGAEQISPSLHLRKQK